jgi:3-oxoacyl-[acyl-carrier protein] reductase
MADPQDVAYATLFLSTDESRYITGQSIMVEGGLIRPEIPLALVEKIIASMH